MCFGQLTKGCDVLLRILVYSENRAFAQEVHKTTLEIVKGFGLKCEIAFSDKIEQQLRADAKTYDIYLIDAQGNNSVKLAAYVRSKSLISSIIFICKKGVSELLIRYRPSAVLSGVEDTERFSKALRWCCNEQIKAHPYFSVKNKDVQMKIGYDTISYFESRQRIVVLHTTKQVIEFYAKLTDVCALLPASDFIRCHQSYVVNMSRIRELDKVNRCFTMMSGVTIDISKSYYPRVVAQYERYLSEH